MVAMRHDQIHIKTKDGSCPAHVFEPEGKGPFPGALLYIDGLGMRPSLVAMGARLSQAGYVVLMPDLFYRTGPYAPADPVKLFSDPAVRADWMKRMTSVATVENIMQDTEAFLDVLAKHPNVKQPNIGVTGYCMGGRMALAAAGHFPDRIAAVASYHGSNLATDDENSPHKLAPKMKARVYVAGAIEDKGFDDAQKKRLEEALTEAGVAHTVETYKARHGWVPSDMPVHDPEAAERHWKTLLALFDQTLRH
jgi:carboxymethylenebutenolidase